MSDYTAQMHTFDSHVFRNDNSYIYSPIMAKNFKSAINKARKSGHEKVQVYDSSYGYHSSNNDFVTLENGTITEASRSPLFNL